MKEVNFTRKITDQDGFEHSEQITLKVPVQPGDSEGTIIRISKAGNVEHGKLQADVHFTIRELPHPHFQRVGRFDLQYSVPLSANCPIFGQCFVIPTLGSINKFQIEIVDYEALGREHRFPGKGFPLPNCQAKERGDLIVVFSIDHSKDNNFEV